MMSSLDVLDAMELRLACMPCTSMSLVACLKESLRDVPADFAKLARPSMSGRSCVAFCEKFFQSGKRGKRDGTTGGQPGRSRSSRFS